MLKPLCVFPNMSDFMRRLVDTEIADSVEIMVWEQAEDQAPALTTTIKDQLFPKMWGITVRAIRTELKWRLVVSKVDGYSRQPGIPPRSPA